MIWSYIIGCGYNTSHISILSGSANFTYCTQKWHISHTQLNISPFFTFHSKAIPAPQGLRPAVIKICVYNVDSDMAWTSQHTENFLLLECGKFTYFYSIFFFCDGSTYCLVIWRVRDFENRVNRILVCQMNWIHIPTP